MNPTADKRRQSKGARVAPRIFVCVLGLTFVPHPQRRPLSLCAFFDFSFLLLSHCFISRVVQAFFMSRISLGLIVHLRAGHLLAFFFSDGEKPMLQPTTSDIQLRLGYGWQLRKPYPGDPFPISSVVVRTYLTTCCHVYLTRAAVTTGAGVCYGRRARVVCFERNVDGYTTRAYDWDCVSYARVSDEKHLELVQP